FGHRGFTTSRNLLPRGNPNSNHSPPTGQSTPAVYFNGEVGEKPRDACGGAMLVVTRRLLVLTLLALASSAAVLFAQSVSGSVSGTVVDQTRQVLPGATVTLLNEQTGDRRAIQTSDVGAFVFPAVQPGVYTVRIELSGFSPFERKNTVVPANEQLSIGSVHLTADSWLET